LKYAIAVMALCLLTACSESPIELADTTTTPKYAERSRETKPSYDDEMAYRRHLAFQCFKDKATDLDDFRSDAGTIAGAAVGACNSEVLPLIRLGARNISMAAYPQFYQSSISALTTAATQAVLLERRERASTSAAGSEKP